MHGNLTSRTLDNSNRMKIKTIILTLGIALLASCTSHEEVQPSRVPIYVGATVEGQQQETRAPYTLTAPSKTSPLNAAVWMSTTQHSFPNSNLGKGDENAPRIAYHNTATFTGRDKQLLNDQLFYPSNDKMVYFVGLYPQTAWTARDASGVSGSLGDCTFDGKTDVMYAPEVFNRYTTAPTYPILAFRHLLTWLRFKVCADSQESADAWGKVTDIKIKSRNRLTMSFQTGSLSFNGDPVNMSAYTPEDQPFTGQAVELYTTPFEVAYVLAEPVTATNSNNEYTLVVSNEGRKDVEVPINLKAKNNTDFTGSTAGHQFTITLKFANGDNIMTTVAVSPWENAGSMIIEVTE